RLYRYNSSLHTFPTRRSSDLGNIETLENEIKKYIRFEDGSIILGAEGSTSEVIITNDKISFMQGGDKPVAFIEGQKMKINQGILDRKSTRLNSSHVSISYAVF